MAELQKAAQVEFAIMSKDGTRSIIRGAIGEVEVPTGQRIIAHTHPGKSIFSVRPSKPDLTTIKWRNQHSSLIITEEGYRIRFSSSGKILGSNLGN